jgi:hypothetical protein
MTIIRISGYMGWEERLEWCIENIGPWSNAQHNIMWACKDWSMIWTGNSNGSRNHRSGNNDWIIEIDDEKLATIFILRWS